MASRHSRRQQGEGQPHNVALNYVQGHGPRPTEEELESVRDGLFGTVQHVDQLLADAEKLREENAQLMAENMRLTAPANVVIVSDPIEKILGGSTPCGQILRVKYNSHEVFATCINAGMGVYGGKCALHAPKDEKPSTTSYAAVARSKQ